MMEIHKKMLQWILQLVYAQAPLFSMLKDSVNVLLVCSKILNKDVLLVRSAIVKNALMLNNVKYVLNPLFLLNKINVLAPLDMVLTKMIFVKLVH